MIIEGQCGDAETDVSFDGAAFDEITGDPKAKPKAAPKPAPKPEPKASIVESGCEVKLKYTGKAACPLLTNPVYDFTKKIPEQIGVSCVVFGLILCFYGSRLLIFIFVAAATVGILIGMNLYVYNMYVPVNATMPIIVLMVIGISCISVALSQFILGFTKKWAIMLVSAWLGMIFALSILKLVKVQNASINLIGALIGTVYGYSLCMKYSHIIPVFSASLIGAYFILRGIDIHFGNYPQEE